MSGQPAGTEGAAVAAYATQRNITEVLHFTTNQGALGIFATGFIMSRDDLDQDKYIEHIYVPNCQDRLKDAEWTGYVNLSISRVNDHMFEVSSKKWHATEDLWWLVLALDVSLLADPGVYFVTTNNTYTECLKRGTGVAGLDALFAPSVEWGWYHSRRTRYAGMPDALTTDPQAEVLYPDRVPIQRIHAVYVREEQHADIVRSWFDVLHVPALPVLHRPDIFQ